jgi:hypothetical protein
VPDPALALRLAERVDVDQPSAIAACRRAIGGERRDPPQAARISRTALNPLELTLGIMTAVGGFVDISELVFAAKAGSNSAMR